MQQPLYANLRPRINQLQTVLIKRSLQGVGKITAKKDQVVEPFDVLGSSILSSGFSTFNLVRALGVSTKDAPKYLYKKIGSTIYKGELLAAKKGLLGNKMITAPTDAIIEAYNDKTGDLLLKFQPKEVPLVAGVYGIIESIDPLKSVVIKVLATEVFGVFGSGKERGGILHLIGRKDSLITKQQINSTQENKILVTGSLIYNDAIKEAVSKNVSGIITGGVNARDYKAISSSLNPKLNIGTDIGLSLLVTEGFGGIGIGDDIFEVVKSYEGRYVFVNGNGVRLLLPSNDADSIIRLKKVSMPVSHLHTAMPQVSLVEIKQGQRARVVWPPFIGTQGVVIGIDQTPTRLPSGISTYLLTLETRLKKFKVPYTNVEII